MQGADQTSSPPAKTILSTHRRLRFLSGACVLILVACQLWAGRYAMDADGTAYVDLARAYLQGDWLHALSPYWSPLFIWQLTAAFGIFHPSMHWELPLIHAIDFLNFAAAFAAWEWLLTEWEKWQGLPSFPILTYVTGHCVVLWAGLRLTTFWFFNTPDILVMALLVAVAALLVRVRRGVSRERDSVLIGVVLGAGFLAKTAFMVVIPIVLLALFVLCQSLHHRARRQLLITMGTAAAVILPFVAAISFAHGRFTTGDSGRLNYSWEVSGFTVEGYKEGAYSPGKIPHPIRVLMKAPRVLSFDEDTFGSYPIHADVSWWCEGYPIRFDKARQLMILWSNIVFSIKAFRCPAVLLFLLALVYGGTRTIKNLGEAWFVWAPGLLFAASYCPIYSDYRYLAASYAVLGFGLIAAAWHVALPRAAATLATGIIPVATVLFLMGWGFRHMPAQLIRDIAGKSAPMNYYNRQVPETLHQNGLRAGDRVAYIGFDLGAAHVGVERAHMVALIPQSVRKDDTAWGRPYLITFPRPDEFWRSSRQKQEEALSAFRSVGAKWVFADTVPKWADIQGWRVAGGSPEMRDTDRPYTYFRKLF